MGSGGFILGGLLSGVGQGIAQDIADRRAQALQQLRGVQAAESDARQAKAAEAAADKKYERDRGLLATGAALDIAKDKAASGNRVTEKQVQGQIDMKLVGARTAGDLALAKLRGSIDAQLASQKGVIDRGLMEAKEEIESGRAASVQQTADGRFFVVRKDGSTLTTQKVGAPPGQKEGEDPIAARRGAGAAPPSPAPAPAPSPTPAPSTAPRPSQAKQPEAGGKPVLSRGEYQNAVNGAIRKRTKGEAGWKGLSDAQIRNKLADIYDAAGYGLPSI